MKKEKKEKKPKPKYNMLQNVSFMLKTAAEAKEKKVIVVIAVLVVIAVGSNLLGVYAAPLVIKGLQDNLLYSYDILHRRLGICTHRSRRSCGYPD